MIYTIHDGMSQSLFRGLREVNFVMKWMLTLQHLYSQVTCEAEGLPVTCDGCSASTQKADSRRSFIKGMDKGLTRARP